MMAGAPRKFLVPLLLVPSITSTHLSSNILSQPSILPTGPKQLLSSRMGLSSVYRMMTSSVSYQQAQTLQHRLAPAQDMCTSYDMATDFEADDYYAQPHLSAEPTASCAAYQQLIRPPLLPRTECIVRDPFLPLRNFDMLGPHQETNTFSCSVLRVQPFSHFS